MSDQTETPWTRGPWEIEPVPKFKFDKYIQAQGGELDINLARVYGGGTDARLIAAAPDMVGLLEEAIDELRDAAKHSDDTGFYRIAEEQQDLAHRIDTLLTEIKGDE